MKLKVPPEGVNSIRNSNCSSPSTKRLVTTVRIMTLSLCLYPIHPNNNIYTYIILSV